MKILSLVLNAVILLSAMLFLAYVGYHYFDFGLFKTLPSGVSGFFLSAGALQYVALGLLIAAAIGKILLSRALKRRDAGTGPDGAVLR
ncbi:hypothetical protein [Microbacterium sp. SA39]|uniref:hypothetical protein n=1 Tax=Microbacterium sp. SA39 TaxID=1263625 RepID=UPI0005FA02D9|nr:hypothetical protein [Microbacterium sp. SA39]KJQ52692.1 hypothetical protein RS85_03585 [Microbacterium sp. SA39]